MPPSLTFRALRRFFIALAFAMALLFVPAWSLRFWQAWLFLALLVGFWGFFLGYFLKHDRRLLERRLQAVEPHVEHKIFQKLFSAILFGGFVTASLDFRVGWSRGIGGVPLAAILVAQALAVAGYYLVFLVMKANTFAASVIRVEAQQSVISSGPYAVVRHPMYSGMTLTALSVPLALVSYVAFPIFALLVPALIYRLIHEERLLRRDLPEYSEYCKRTRFRLVPGVW